MDSDEDQKHGILTNNNNNNNMSVNNNNNTSTMSHVNQEQLKQFVEQLAESQLHTQLKAAAYPASLLVRPSNFR